MSYPEISSGLISHLEKIFPDKASRHNDGGLFSFGVEAGKQLVIDHLRSNYNKQQEQAHVHAKGP